MRNIFLFLLCSLISACGFHLRQTAALPESLQQIHLSSFKIHSHFSNSLGHDLQLAGATLVEDPLDAPYTLKVIQENLAERITGVSGNTQLRRNNIKYTITYELTDRQDHVITHPTTIVAHRHIVMNSSQLLGSLHERNALITEMEHEIAGKIVEQLRISKRA